MTAPKLPILVAVDDGESSEEALRQADARARAAGVPLVVRSVIPDVLRINPLVATMPLPYDASAVEVAVLEQLRDRVAFLTKRDPEGVDIGVLDGVPHAAIVEEAERLRAGLIVVGTHGRKGIVRAVLGSVAERIARYATCPVLVARPRTHGGRVLVATDFSDPSIPAVRAGVDEAARVGGRLTVVHCLDLSALDWVGTTLGGAGRPGGAVPEIGPTSVRFSDASIAEMRGRAEERIHAALAACGATGDALVVEGAPAECVIEAATKVDAEIIVVATSGRTGLRRVAMGSVAELIVRRASTSVLVVRLEHGSGT